MRKSRTRLLLALATLATAAGWVRAARAATAVIDSAYRQSFDRWQGEQVEDLKQNWLTLAGLFWLKPGSNRFGSGADQDIVLPAGRAPLQAGSFEFDRGQVTVRLAGGTRATVAGGTFTEAPLRSDAPGPPTVIEMGSLRMYVIERGKRTGIRVKDLESPAAERYRGPIFYDLSARYLIDAAWVPSAGKQTVDVPNVLGDLIPTPVSGAVHFTLDGEQQQLIELGGNPAKGLFFVFSDATSRTDTYPGGRFLETGPVVDGHVLLDFNRAYNPPCAVTPYATCPLAPAQNRLRIAITAGERYDRSQGHP
jgi:uncharacterized protein (DUF1684 family)